MRHIAQAKCHGDDIEMPIGERQLLCIAHHRGQGEASIMQPITAYAQHGFVDVGVHHLPAQAHLFGKSQS